MDNMELIFGEPSDRLCAVASRQRAGSRRGLGDNLVIPKLENPKLRIPGFRTKTEVRIPEYQSLDFLLGIPNDCYDFGGDLKS